MLQRCLVKDGLAEVHLDMVWDPLTWGQNLEHGISQLPLNRRVISYMNVIILFAVIAIITASIGGLSLSIAGLGLLLKYTLLGSIVQHPRSNCERLLQWIVAHIKTFVWVGGLLLVLSICLKVTILVLWLNYT